ncbi:MAG: hypothetical protein LBU50_03840, partial [Cellulomonas sp.]|nr:hypothetical protein [Cellulomonas sp.]
TLAALIEKVSAALRDDDCRPPRPDAPEGWGRPGPGPRRGRSWRAAPDRDEAPARGRGRRGPDGLARSAEAPRRGWGRRGPGWAW